MAIKKDDFPLWEVHIKKKKKKKFNIAKSYTQLFISSCKAVRNNLAVKPNPEVAGHPKPTNKKNPGNIGYTIFDKIHFVYSDQCVGAVCRNSQHLS